MHAHAARRKSAQVMRSDQPAIRRPQGACLDAVVPVICCFCAEALDDAWATTSTVAPPGSEDETQGLRCHGRCLLDRLHPSIPFHPGIKDA